MVASYCRTYSQIKNVSTLITAHSPAFFQENSILWAIVCQCSYFNLDMLHSCSLSRSSDAPRSPSGSNHVKKVDLEKEKIKKSQHLCYFESSDINHLCAVFFHCVVIRLSHKASLWGGRPCNFISRYAWLLVRQWWRGRNGWRGGEEWWESPEAFTRGDKDQQQNKNRPFLLFFFFFLFALWERKTRVCPSQPYYKTTEEEEDVHRQRSFMEAGQAPGFL